MITMIVKVDRNNLIGDSERNRMPWEDIELTQVVRDANKADMKRFVTLRKGSHPDTAPDIVIMGRKTWESIPGRYRPFSQNINYIISRNPNLELGDTKGEEVKIFKSVDDCLDYCKQGYPDRDVHIIGGGQIYQYLLQHNLVDRIEMTVLDHEFEGDIYFPHLGHERTEIQRQDFDGYCFITYQNINKL